MFLITLMLQCCSFFTPLLIRYLWHLETVVFLHWCQLCATPLQHSVLITLSVNATLQNNTSLSVVMLSVAFFIFIPIVVMLTVIVPSVVAPTSVLGPVL